MKMKPLYAALDLHSAHSVLGSMDHEGKSQGQVRFVTAADALREQGGEAGPEETAAGASDLGSEQAEPVGGGDCAALSGATGDLRTAA